MFHLGLYLLKSSVALLHPGMLIGRAQASPGVLAGPLLKLISRSRSQSSLIWFVLQRQGYLIRTTS